jgi:hypothetical protein
MSSIGSNQNDKLSVKEKLAMWRSQKESSISNHTSAKFEDKSISTWSRSVPPARRNNLILKTSAEKTKKNFNQEILSNKADSMSESKGLKENIRDQNAAVTCSEDKINSNISCLLDENNMLKKELKLEKEIRNEVVNSGLMAYNEIHALNFLNDILQQKNADLENQISSDRLTQNENASNKSRKHKQEVEKLKEEKENFERRANELIGQLNEQMTMLQTVAMDRITVIFNNCYFYIFA